MAHNACILICSPAPALAMIKKVQRVSRSHAICLPEWANKPQATPRHAEERIESQRCGRRARMQPSAAWHASPCLLACISGLADHAEQAAPGGALTSREASLHPPAVSIERPD